MDAFPLDCEVLGDLPAASAKRWGEKVAIEFGQQRWTFSEFDIEVERAAAALRAVGIGPGDRVGIWLNNRPEFEFAIFAVWRVGGIAVPFNTRYRRNDLSFVLRQSGCRLLIAEPVSGPVDYDGILVDVLGDLTVAPSGALRSERFPALRHLLMLDESRIPWAMSWAHFLERGKVVPANGGDGRRVSRQDAAIIMYTSGTTGEPKGVVLDHAGVRLCRDRAIVAGLQEHDIQLAYLPLFHQYALSYTMIMSLQCGTKQILMDFFDPDRALDHIEKDAASVIHGFDVHFSDLLAANQRKPRNLASLRFGTLTVGAESSVTMARTVQDVLCPTLSGYGMTEVWGGVAITPADSTVEQRCECSGCPLPGIEIRIVDPETRQPLPAGHMGEFQVRGYARMIGYHDQPDATAKAFTKDGWFETGDAGLIREDGHLRFLGRYKDMLKVGGENTSPSEIEATILDLPGLAGVAVVGAQHERLGEVAVAFVQRADGATVTEEDVIVHCRGKIASFKVPARVIFVDSFPLTATGKIQKAMLRQRLAEERDARTTA